MSFVPFERAMTEDLGPTVESDYDGDPAFGEDVTSVIITKRDAVEDAWEVIYLSLRQAEWVASKMAEAIAEIKSRCLPKLTACEGPHRSFSCGACGGTLPPNEPCPVCEALEETLGPAREPCPSCEHKGGPCSAHVANSANPDVSFICDRLEADLAVISDRS